MPASPFRLCKPSSCSSINSGWHRDSSSSSNGSSSRELGLAKLLRPHLWGWRLALLLVMAAWLHGLAGYPGLAR
jgi:hypothetical protein